MRSDSSGSTDSIALAMEGGSNEILVFDRTISSKFICFVL